MKSLLGKELLRVTEGTPGWVMEEWCLWCCMVAILFILFKITADGDHSHEINFIAPWKKSYDKPRQHIIKQRHYFANKGPSSQSYGFSSSHVQMWELDHKEGWVPKNWCFQTVVLEKTLESSLDSKEIKPVNPKGNQPWIFIGRTDEEAENLTLRPPDAEPTHWKRPWCWKRLKAKEKRVAEDDMVR